MCRPWPSQEIPGGTWRQETFTVLAASAVLDLPSRRRAEEAHDHQHLYHLRGQRLLHLEIGHPRNRLRHPRQRHEADLVAVVHGGHPAGGEAVGEKGQLLSDCWDGDACRLGDGSVTAAQVGEEAPGQDGALPLRTLLRLHAADQGRGCGQGQAPRSFS